jgi:hypothetical protein
MAEAAFSVGLPVRGCNRLLLMLERQFPTLKEARMASSIHTDYVEAQTRKEQQAIADELLRRGKARWGVGVCVQRDGLLCLAPGSPAAAEHGALTDLHI